MWSYTKLSLPSRWKGLKVMDSFAWWALQKGQLVSSYWTIQTQDWKSKMPCFFNLCSASPAVCTAASCMAFESGRPGCRWAGSCLHSICYPALLPPGCCSRRWFWKRGGSSSSSSVTQLAGQNVNKILQCKSHCSPFGQILNSPVLLSLLPAGRRSCPAADLIWHVAAVVLPAALQSSRDAATW